MRRRLTIYLVASILGPLAAPCRDDLLLLLPAATITQVDVAGVERSKFGASNRRALFHVCQVVIQFVQASQVRRWYPVGAIGRHVRGGSR